MIDSSKRGKVFMTDFIPRIYYNATTNLNGVNTRHLGSWVERCLNQKHKLILNK